RVRAARTVAVRTLGIVTALFAAAIVTTFTVDIGPTLKARAEAEASKYLRRPMTIGRLSARVRPGSFLLEDVVIEGRTPESRPFLRAERISVELPWWTIFRGELLFEEIRMTGWDLYIESFADGSHNMPRMMPDRRPSGP